MGIAQTEQTGNKNFRELRAAGIWKPTVCEEGQRLLDGFDDKKRKAKQRLKALKDQPASRERVEGLIEFAASLCDGVRSGMDGMAAFNDGRTTPIMEDLAGWASLDTVVREDLELSRELADIQDEAFLLIRAQMRAEQDPA